MVIAVVFQHWVLLGGWPLGTRVVQAAAAVRAEVTGSPARWISRASGPA